MDTDVIRVNYQSVLGRIRQAALVVGRDPESVKLVVVTKGHAIGAVLAALDAGVRVFGENYAEEGVTKRLACSASEGLEWHMIGHVQSRKARLVAEHFDYVHSVDSLKISQRLSRFASEFGRRMPVLLECNVSGEESKFGWPAWGERAWGELLEPFAQVIELPGLQVRGLMCMAPFLPDPEQARPYFQRLKRLGSFLAKAFPGVAWTEFSMGMSADFEVAVQEGATLVRVGTAIMGPRADTIDA
ncbi:MAG: YggS family pyridoxal phosphate-dependent enzyme [Chloroflexota bacterium]